MTDPNYVQQMQTPTPTSGPSLFPPFSHLWDRSKPCRLSLKVYMFFYSVGGLASHFWQIGEEGGHFMPWIVIVGFWGVCGAEERL